jgi:hypothetical protein
MVRAWQEGDDAVTETPTADPRAEDRRPLRRALVSVSDKTGLEALALGLHQAGVVIVSTGSTAARIAASGVPVTPVEAVTGFPECLDGRVKTLHPAVHAGILADRTRASHTTELAGLGIEPFDLVVVNLYPFTQTVAAGAAPDECVEQIDIGGPAMVRAAAKNHGSVAVVVEAQVGQDPGMHLRVQRLDPPVEALREPGQVLDLGDRDAELLDEPGRASRRHQRHARAVQPANQLLQPGLVVDGHQGPLDRDLAVAGGAVGAHAPNRTFLSVMVKPSRASRPTLSTSICRSATLIRSWSASTSSSSSTGTTAWAMIGPVSTPASTTKSVAPVTFTPYARASAGPLVPGNDGSSAGWVLT